MPMNYNMDEALAKAKRSWLAAQEAGDQGLMDTWHNAANALRQQGANEERANQLVYGDQKGTQMTQQYSHQYTGTSSPTTTSAPSATGTSSPTTTAAPSPTQGFVPVRDTLVSMGIPNEQIGWDAHNQLPTIYGRAMDLTGLQNLPYGGYTSGGQTWADPAELEQWAERFIPTAALHDSGISSETRSILGQIHQYLENQPQNIPDIENTDMYRMLMGQMRGVTDDQMRHARAQLAAMGVLGEGSTPAAERFAQIGRQAGYDIASQIPAMYDTAFGFSQRGFDNLVTAAVNMANIENISFNQAMQRLQAQQEQDRWLWERPMLEEEFDWRRDLHNMTMQEREAAIRQMDAQNAAKVAQARAVGEAEANRILNDQQKWLLDNQGWVEMPDGTIITTPQYRKEVETRETRGIITHLSILLAQGNYEAAMAEVAKGSADWAARGVNGPEVLDFIIDWVQKNVDQAWDHDILSGMLRLADRAKQERAYWAQYIP